MDVRIIYDRFIKRIGEYIDDAFLPHEFATLFNSSAIAELRACDPGGKLRRQTLGYSIEYTQQDIEFWHPLIEEIEAGVDETTGDCTYSDIRALISATQMQTTESFETPDFKPDIYHIQSVSIKYGNGAFQKCTWSRQNQFLDRIESVIDPVSVTSPIWTYGANKIKVLPIEANVTAKVNFIRYPVDIFLDTADATNNIDSELPDKTIEKIIDRAVTSALAPRQGDSGASYQAALQEENRS